MQHSNSLTSLHCPTCNGPLSKDVLENPVQCIYCDVWVATNNGRQQKVILSQTQIADLEKGIQPSEPIFKEGSALDRLFGRIRRVVPMVIGVPFVWVLMMHLFVGQKWVGCGRTLHLCGVGVCGGDWLRYAFGSTGVFDVFVRIVFIAHTS